MTEIPKGFYKCIDCGTICERVNSKQKRCKPCQEIYSLVSKRQRQREKRRQNKK